jgi:hypothetical protein
MAKETSPSSYNWSYYTSCINPTLLFHLFVELLIFKKEITILITVEKILFQLIYNSEFALGRGVRENGT